MTSIIPSHLLPNWSPTFTSLKPITTNQSLEGSQVINLLHSGYNISSNNSTKGQNLVIAANSDIIESSRTPEINLKSISPLFLIAGGIALFLILK